MRIKSSRITAWYEAQAALVLHDVDQIDDAEIMKHVDAVLDFDEAKHGADPGNSDQKAELWKATQERWHEIAAHGPFSVGIPDGPIPLELDEPGPQTTDVLDFVSRLIVPEWFENANIEALNRRPQLLELVCLELVQLGDTEAAKQLRRVGAERSRSQESLSPSWSPSSAIPEWSPRTHGRPALLTLTLAIWNQVVGPRLQRAQRPAAVQMDWMAEMEQANYYANVVRVSPEVVAALGNAAAHPSFVRLFLRIADGLYRNTRDDGNRHLDRVRLPSLSTLKAELGARSTSDLRRALEWGHRYEWDHTKGKATGLWTWNHMRGGRNRPGEVVVTCSAAMTDAVVKAGFKDNGSTVNIVPLFSWKRERPAALDKGQSGAEWVLWLMLPRALRAKWAGYDNGWELPPKWWEELLIDAGIDSKHAEKVKAAYLEDKVFVQTGDRWRLGPEFQNVQDALATGINKSLHGQAGGKKGVRNRGKTKDKRRK